MVIMDFNSEYIVEISCPNCGCKDIIIENFLGFFGFYACKKCGFKKEKSETVKEP